MGTAVWRRSLVATLSAVLIFEAGVTAPASPVSAATSDGESKAFATAEVRQAPTELVDERTESSRTFDNHDGSFLARAASPAIAALAAKALENIRANRRVATKCVVIGESMARVRASATVYGCSWWSGLGVMAASSLRSRAQWYAATFAANVAWIRSKMAEGYVIIDIGPDFAARAAGTRCASSFYLMEYYTTRRYKGTVHTWNRAVSVFAHARCFK